MPRSIKLVGIGEGGEKIAAKVAECNLSNVDVVPPTVSRHDAAESSGSASTGMLQAIATEGNELAKLLQGANMVFLVANYDDDISFAPVISGIAHRMGVLVTGIMVQDQTQNKEETAKQGLETLRAASDMLVITSDESYVIEMLGSLGA
jgi:cell division GTPase FtsZ